MYEPASLGMFQCRLQRILCDFEVIMFFRKDPPQTEGRRDADPLIKTAPVSFTQYGLTVLTLEHHTSWRLGRIA